MTQPASSKTFDVVSFGEGLVDFFPTDTSVPMSQADTFLKAVGGAPVNLAFGAARLGARVAMMGKLGRDDFGTFICEHLAAQGVHTDTLVMDPNSRTGITFVRIGPNGERSFLFYRFKSAELTIQPEDINIECLRKSRIVHTGTNLMRIPKPREATFLLLREAHNAGCIVSVDANIRAHLWEDQDAIASSILDTLAWADILKVNEDEYAFLFQDRPSREVFADLHNTTNLKALVVTWGPLGSEVLTPHTHLHVPAPNVNAVDTTGAGDAFLATMLRTLSLILRDTDDAPHALEHLGQDTWRAVLTRSNDIASRVCTQLGAVTAIPHSDELDWTSFSPTNAQTFSS